MGWRLTSAHTSSELIPHVFYLDQIHENAGHHINADLLKEFLGDPFSVRTGVILLENQLTAGAPNDMALINLL